jgi:hypothetical protein
MGEEVVEEGRFASAGLATEHDHPAGPGPRILDQAIEQFTLGVAVL